MKACNEVKKGTFLSPAELVGLYWESAAPELMPASIRTARAPEEQLVAHFKEWYDIFLEITYKENRDRLPEARDTLPPEPFVIAALVDDYRTRVEAARAIATERRNRFESLARPRLGKHVAYWESASAFFMAELRNVATNEEEVRVTLGIVPTLGLDFFPEVPLIPIFETGGFTLSAGWDLFYFDELRWHLPHVSWTIFFDESALANLKSHAATLSNLPAKERVWILACALLKDTNRAAEARGFEQQEFL